MTGIYSSAFENMIDLAGKSKTNVEASFCEVNKRTLDTVKVDDDHLKITAEVRCYKTVGKDTFKKVSSTMYTCDVIKHGKEFTVSKCTIA